MRTEKIFLLLLLSLSLTFCATTQSKLAEKREKDPQYKYEKAVVAMNYGLAAEAVTYLKEALLLDSSHYLSYSLLGLAHISLKNFEEAAAAFRSCLDIRPDFSEAHNHLGFVYEEMDIFDQAEEEYKKAYALDANAVASFNLAKLYYKQKKLELALEFAQKSLEKNSRLKDGYNLQGVILNQLGRYPEAIASFQQALSLAPQDVMVSVNLGIAFINNKEFDQARTLLEKILPLVQDEKLRDRINEYLKIIKQSVRETRAFTE